MWFPTPSNRVLSIRGIEVDAVIFDMDGLLFDTEAIARRALEATFAQFGSVLTDERHRLLVGLCEEQTSEMLRAWFGPDLCCQAFHRQCHRRITALRRDALVIKPGAQELLSHLKNLEAPVGLATSSDRITAKRNLAQAKLEECFHAVATRDDVSRGKPDPAVYLHAANSLGILPARCLALEDSPIGAHAALAAGMPTILVPDALEVEPELHTQLLAVFPNLHSVTAELRINVQF